MTGHGRRRAVLIAGPTASGKSALAAEVARATGGIIVNADSMQVYRELRVLTARPTEAETAVLPHRLYGHVPAAEAYSVGRWLADLGTVLAEAAVDGRPAILVGGTGLYFEAAAEGLARVPPVPAEVREAVRREAEGMPAAELHSRLAVADPLMAARLRPSDPQRILRALEVKAATGRSLADWQAEKAPPLLAGWDVVRVVLAPDRVWLHTRIDARAAAMAEAGAGREAEALVALGLPADRPAMRAIGVAPFAAAAAGAISAEEAVARTATATRQYAKRQETWFRGRMAGWERADPRDAGVAEQVVAAVEGGGGHPGTA